MRWLLLTVLASQVAVSLNHAFFTLSMNSAGGSVRTIYIPFKSGIGVFSNTVKRQVVQLDRFRSSVYLVSKLNLRSKKVSKSNGCETPQ